MYHERNVEKEGGDKMVDYTKTNQCQYDPSNTAKATYNYTDCVHRLPCGYCPFLSRQCPKYYSVTYATINNTTTTQKAN